MIRGQLRHLAESAQRSKTTIQVVPYRAGAHAGTTGPFVILDFPEPTDPAVVYVETLAGDIYLEQRYQRLARLARARYGQLSLEADGLGEDGGSVVQIGQAGGKSGDS